MKKLILLIAVLFGVTACGVKGPLYFPEQAPQTQSSQTETQ